MKVAQLWSMDTVLSTFVSLSASKYENTQVQLMDGKESETTGAKIGLNILKIFQIHWRKQVLSDSDETLFVELLSLEISSIPECHPKAIKKYEQMNEQKRHLFSVFQTQPKADHVSFLETW